MSHFTLLCKPLLRTPTRRFFTAFLLALALFLLSLTVATPTFYDNDDTNIAFALAGYFTGEPYPAHPFIHPLLSLAVSTLYRLAPALPWWYLVQAAAVLISLALIGSVLLSHVDAGRLPLLVALIVYGCLLAGFMLYALLLATFTLTAACLGSAGVALLLHPQPNRKTDCGAAILLLFCFLFRISSGLSLSCFYFAALLYRLIAAGKGQRGRVLWLCGISLLVVITLYGTNLLGQRHFHADAFPAFDAVRGRYMDYPVLSYSDAPALYQSVGWDATLYTLVKNWFYMDERVTAEALETLLEAGAVHTAPGAAMDDFRSFLHLRPLAVYQGLMPVLLLVAGLGLLPKKKERKAAPPTLPLFFAVCMLLGAAVLIAYLLLSGRIVLRAFQLLIIPAAVSILLLGLNALPVNPRPLRRYLLPLLVLIPLLFCGYRSAGITLRYDAETMLTKSRALTSYAIDHPDTVFIRDTQVANNIDALTTYPDRQPTNLLDWGGTSMYTGARELQLDTNRLRPFTAERFLDERVRFVTETDSRAHRSLSDYMDARYNAALIYETTVTPGVDIYRIERRENAA